MNSFEPDHRQRRDDLQLCLGDRQRAAIAADLSLLSLSNHRAGAFAEVRLVF
jgi:hypothetical protein